MTVAKKKMNTYLKYGLWMLIYAFAGGVLGFSYVYFGADSLGGFFKTASNVARGHLLGIQAFFLAASVLIEEPVLYKFRAFGKELENSEDEQSDVLEYRMEKLTALGMTASIVGLVLAMIVLSTGYSMDYIKSLSVEGNKNILAVFVLFILDCVYNGFWQVRYVKSVQKIYPDQKADVASLKFQEQWLESCDEAEREMIYQASYKSHLCIHKLVSVLAVAAMLSHLFWNTGIMAVVMVGIIWIGMTVTYCRACVKKKGSKLNT